MRSRLASHDGGTPCPTHEPTRSTDSEWSTSGAARGRSTETDPLNRVAKHQYDSFGNETTTIHDYVAGQTATADRNVATIAEFDQATTAGKAGLPTKAQTRPAGC